MSPSATSSMTAAIRRALAITLRAVSTISAPARRIERSECVPPPDASVALSPPRKLIASGVTPSRSAITCRKLVSWPCPLDCVPTNRSTAVGFDLHRHALVRHADRGLEIVGDADAEQPAAPLRLLAAGGKAVPVGASTRARDVAGEIAAVVGEPGGRAIGQLVARESCCGGAARPGRSPAARAAISISRSMTSVASGPAGAAKGRGRHRIGHRAAHAHMRGRHVVERGRDPVAVAERHIGHGLRADIADVRRSRARACGPTRSSASLASVTKSRA